MVAAETYALPWWLHWFLPLASFAALTVVALIASWVAAVSAGLARLPSVARESWLWQARAAWPVRRVLRGAMLALPLMSAVWLPLFIGRYRHTAARAFLVLALAAFALAGYSLARYGIDRRLAKHCGLPLLGRVQLATIITWLPVVTLLFAIRHLAAWFGWPWHAGALVWLVASPAVAALVAVGRIDLRLTTWLGFSRKAPLRLQGIVADLSRLAGIRSVPVLYLAEHAFPWVAANPARTALLASPALVKRSADEELANYLFFPLLMVSMGPRPRWLQLNARLLSWTPVAIPWHEAVFLGPERGSVLPISLGALLWIALTLGLLKWLEWREMKVLAPRLAQLAPQALGAWGASGSLASHRDDSVAHTVADTAARDLAHTAAREDGGLPTATGTPISVTALRFYEVGRIPWQEDLSPKTPPIRLSEASLRDAGLVPVPPPDKRLQWRGYAGLVTTFVGLSVVAALCWNLARKQARSATWQAALAFDPSRVLFNRSSDAPSVDAFGYLHAGLNMEAQEGRLFAARLAQLYLEKGEIEKACQMYREAVGLDLPQRHREQRQYVAEAMAIVRASCPANK